MRTGTVKISGNEYRICLSTRVLMTLEDKGLTLDSVFADSSKQITNVFTLLSLMMDAGKRWAELNGEDAPTPPTLDELMDSTAVDEYGEIVSSLASALQNTTRNVEAKPAKKKGGNAM